MRGISGLEFCLAHHREGKYGFHPKSMRYCLPVDSRSLKVRQLMKEKRGIF